MRILFIIAIGVFSFSCFSQSNEPAVPQTNSTNSINQEGKKNLLEESLKKEEKEEKNDTLMMLEKSKAAEDLDDQRNYKTATKKSVSKSSGTDYISPPSVQQKETSSAESMSTGFYSTKMKSSTQRTQRTPSIEQQTQMDETVRYFEQYAPESFEYHYYKYVAGNYSTALADHLFKANQLKPNNTDVHIQLAAYYRIIGDTVNESVFLKKIKTINRITNDVAIYAKDLLLSVPQNGTLITHGFDDTYSCAYLQTVEKVRTDVELISLDFLQSEVYRSKLKEKGYQLPVNSVIDVAYLSSFCALNEKKNLAISLTAPKEYFQAIQAHLFVVGLTFEYHSEAFNNFDKNDYLWNEVLGKKLVYNSLNEKSKQISSNYLPMLLQLRTVYLQQNNMLKVNEIDEALDKVSVQCKKYDQVQKMKKSSY